ncbi:MAG TPA: cysteine hydrolase family protein [Deltaproteobacteria bacterium]|jgi:nicotinamidase-related amidase|nr:cysteine hydrolase family protein [Deltaproteobacteria bacterium]HOI07322.1 cysteine hydrolase family protein [Deltaproteobacteria bacterium]
MNTALLIVDIQKDYFPGGKMELQGSIEASGHARALLAHFRATGLPVVHIQHVSLRQGATFFLPDTEGVEIHEAVSPVEGEAVFRKHFPNSFRETGLLEHLKALGTGGLVIAGMMTHMCIDATTRAAWDLGFACTVVHDACATKDLAFGGLTVQASHVHHAFLAALNGTYAQVISAEEFLAKP